MKIPYNRKSSHYTQKKQIKDNTFIEKVKSEISIPNDFHWKYLAAYVDDLKGYLSDADLEEISTIIRGRDFCAYLNLSETWGLESINTHGAMSELSNWKARYHISSLLKKLDIDDINFDKAATALDKFLSAEKRCKFFNLFKQQIELGTTSFDRELLAYARAFLKKLLTEKVPIQTEYPALQTIVYHSKKINAIFGPLFSELTSVS